MRTKLNGLLTLLLAFVVQISFAQDKTITGNVTDANSLPLPGVNIVVEGTTIGTQTDFDGNYSISASQGQFLIFTYIGQTTVRRAVGAGNIINVQMEEDAQALEEVVVTGALRVTREQKSLGYAAEKVGRDNLIEARDNGVHNALAGKVSGVQLLGAPSSDFRESSIRLRGNTDVLFIVDNIKVGAVTD